MNTMTLLKYHQISLLTFAVKAVLDAFQMVMIQMRQLAGGDLCAMLELQVFFATA